MSGINPTNKSNKKKKNPPPPPALPQGRSVPNTPYQSSNRGKNHNVNVSDEQWHRVQKARKQFSIYVSSMVSHQNTGNTLTIAAIRKLNSKLASLHPECIVSPHAPTHHKHYWGSMNDEIIKRGLSNWDELLERVKDHDKEEEEKRCIAEIIGDSSSNPSGSGSNANDLLQSLSSTIPSTIPDDPLKLIGRTERIPKKNRKRKIAELNPNSSSNKKQRIESVMYL